MADFYKSGCAGMSHHLEFEQWVPFPLDRVFAFFANPENLPRIMPVRSGTRLISLNRVAPEEVASQESGSNAAGVGSTILTSFLVFPPLPFRRRWLARITAFEWNHHFADVQDEGPFKRWHHRHEFASELKAGAMGTTIRDVIDYEIGFGILGSISNALFVRRQMENTFAERQRRLPELLR